MSEKSFRVSMPMIAFKIKSVSTFANHEWQKLFLSSIQSSFCWCRENFIEQVKQKISWSLNNNDPQVFNKVFRKNSITTRFTLLDKGSKFRNTRYLNFIEAVWVKNVILSIFVIVVYLESIDLHPASKREWERKQVSALLQENLVEFLLCKASETEKETWNESR